MYTLLCRLSFSPHSLPVQAHTAALQKRVAGLELQLGQYNSLLEAAAPSSPRSARASPGQRGAAGGSPMQAALSAVRARREAEEEAALREQLKVAHTEAAQLRK